MIAVDESVAAQIAELQATTHPVPESLGYGTDLYCPDDIDRTARSTTGLESLAQDVYHWLITASGSLPGDTAEERSWGLGLPMMLSHADNRQFLGLEGQIEQGLSEDDRIKQVTATVDFSGTTVTVSVSIIPKDSTEAFDLVVFVAADGSTQLELQ